MLNLFINQTYFRQTFFPKYAYPQTLNYPLMSSFWPTIYISLFYMIGCYLYVVYFKQKNQHKDVKQLDLKRSDYVMIGYNFFMVIWMCYMFLIGLDVLIKDKYHLGCVKLPNPFDQRTNNLVFHAYIYYLSKFVEFFDTFLFLWRGKLDQVTFLHVIHHGSMPPALWLGVKYCPGLDRLQVFN